MVSAITSWSGPCQGSMATAERVAKNADAAAVSQCLFRELRRHVQTPMGWHGAEERWRLLLSESGSYWQEHSERATLATWSSGAKLKPEVRKVMGRWKRTVGEGYFRHEKALILEAQRQIMIEFRLDSLKKDTFGLGETLRGLRDHLLRREVDRQDIDLQLEYLRLEHEVAGGLGRRGPAPGGGAAVG